jgi:hypothetical protein
MDPAMPRELEEKGTARADLVEARSAFLSRACPFCAAIGEINPALYGQSEVVTLPFLPEAV